MNPHSGTGNKDETNDDNSARTKAVATFSMAGIIVAAALLSGMLSLVSSYPQPALAQQNMTGTNATTTASTATGGGGGAAQSACTPSQTGGGQNATSNATTTTGAGGAATGGGNATSGANETSTNATGTEGGNQSTSTVRDFIEQACMAAQNGDMQGVMMRLNLALNALGGNMTTGASEGEAIANTAAGGEFSEEEGGRAETVEEREEGEDQSPGQSMTEEEE